MPQQFHQEDAKSRKKMDGDKNPKLNIGLGLKKIYTNGKAEERILNFTGKYNK